MAALSLVARYALAAEVVVRYPPPEVASDPRNGYQLALLSLALRLGTPPGSGDSYRLEPAPLPVMQQARVAVELRRGELIDVIWTVSTVQREADLLPIRIPIDKGLGGWRVGLVRAADVDKLANVHSLSDLQHVSMAQGHDWPDLEILRSNGIPMQQSSAYEALFRMLAQGRYDYFPRTVEEAWAEERQHADMKLAVEPYIALHYPSASYFFVSRLNPQLGETIRRGMEKALADGSFDRLFNQYFGATLRIARLTERTVIELKNPLLPPQTVLDRADYWYQPKHGR